MIIPGTMRSSLLLVSGACHPLRSDGGPKIGPDHCDLAMVFRDTGAVLKKENTAFIGEPLNCIGCGFTLAWEWEEIA
jgi:hypothetical protein